MLKKCTFVSDSQPKMVMSNETHAGVLSLECDPTHHCTVTDGVGPFHTDYLRRQIRDAAKLSLLYVSNFHTVMR